MLQGDGVKGQSALIQVCRRAKATPRRMCNLDPHRPTPFFLGCRLKHKGRAFEAATDGSIVRLTLKEAGNPTAFSVNRPDEVCFFDRELRGIRELPGLRVYVSDDADASSARAVFASAEVPNAIRALGLGQEESLHVYENAVVLYVMPRGADEDWLQLERLIALETVLGSAGGVAEDGAVRDGLRWRSEQLPDGLRDLLPLVREWAIGDDSCRSDRIDAASRGDLERFVAAAAPHQSAITAYLASVGEAHPCPDEAILLDWLMTSLSEAEEALRGARGE